MLTVEMQQHGHLAYASEGRKHTNDDHFGADKYLKGASNSYRVDDDLQLPGFFTKQSYSFCGLLTCS